MSQRADRVGHLLQQELAGLLRELKDPRVQKATLVGITHVRVSDDLGVAKVMLSVVDAEPMQVVRAVGKAQKFIHGQLLRRLSAKKIPELRFYLDDTDERASGIDAILREVKAEPPVGASSDPGRPAQAAVPVHEEKDDGGEPAAEPFDRPETDGHHDD